MACVGSVDSVPVSCETCSESWEEPLTVALLSSPGDTVTFAAGSVAATCPFCGRLLTNAAATTGSMAYEGFRVPIMRLTNTIKDLAGRDRNELIALRAELQQARIAHDAALAAQALDRGGVSSWLSTQESRLELWALPAVMVALLQLIISLRPADVTPSRDEITKIVVNVTVKIQEGHLPRA